MLSMMKVSEAPFYVVMSEHNELASHRTLNFGHLDEKSWVLFGRAVHPPLYDSVMRVAEGHKVRPRDVHHIMVPEEAFEIIAERNGIAFLTKTGALRIARDRVTLRPLIEEHSYSSYTDANVETLRASSSTWPDLRPLGIGERELQAARRLTSVASVARWPESCRNPVANAGTACSFMQSIYRC
jgi:hypothetical protein